MEFFATIGIIASGIGIGYGVYKLGCFFINLMDKQDANQATLKYLEKCEELNSELLISYNDRLIGLESWYVSQRDKNG